MMMNYITEMKNFERWLKGNSLSAVAQLLYYKLLLRFNNSMWKEWILADNYGLMSDMQIGSRSTFVRARNALIEAGLIEMVSGKKNFPCQYRLIPIAQNMLDKKAEIDSARNKSIDLCVKNEHENDTYSKSVPDCVSNSVSKMDTINNNIINNKYKKNNTNVLLEKKQSEPDEADEILKLYNKICLSFEPVEKLTARQRKAIHTRLKAGKTISDFERLFVMAEESEFLKGNNIYGWSASFNWLIRKGNMDKVLSNKYKNTEKKNVAKSAPNTEPKKNKFHNFEERKTDYAALMMESVLGWLGDSATEFKQEKQKETQEDLQSQFLAYGMPSFAL